MGKQMKAKDVKCYYLCPKNFSRSCDDVLGCEDAVEKETCNCDKESLRRVLNLQKRAARVILNAPPPSSTISSLVQLAEMVAYTDALISKCIIAYKR